MFNNRIFEGINMKKTTKTNATESTEIKKEKGRYNNYIQEMKSYESNLTFFNRLLDKTLKNPNDKNINELNGCLEELQSARRLTY